jgi:hypothetical protein
MAPLAGRESMKSVIEVRSLNSEVTSKPNNAEDSSKGRDSLALTPVGGHLLREDVHYEKSAEGVHA